MSESIRGIIHVHSDFSKDGMCSIADLADFAQEAGCQFVCLTDHAEDLSLEDMKIIREECEKYSDESCVMIPGLEFRCDDDIHILGIGVTDDIVSSDAVTVVTHITAMGGLAILAHPGRNGYRYPEELWTALNGIEIWNAGYDGRFVPPLANLRLFQEARSMNPEVVGFGGADLHDLDGPPGVVIRVREYGSNKFTIQEVLCGLRSGKFSVHGKYLSFDASKGPYWLKGVPLRTLRKVYEISRDFRTAVLGES